MNNNMTTVTFKTNWWSRDAWSDEMTTEKLEDIFNEVKSYVGLSEEFEYCDFFGNSKLCKVEITNITMDKDSIFITMGCNIKIPKHYIPAPWQIIQPNFIGEIDGNEEKEFYSKFNFLFPPSSSIIY